MNVIFLSFINLSFTLLGFQSNKTTFHPIEASESVTLSLENEEFIVTNYKVDVFFEKNKRDEVFVIYKTSITLKSQTYIPQKFIYPIFFDNQTSIDNVRKINKKRNNKINLISSDYEQNGIFHSDLKISYLEHEFTEYGEEVQFEFEKVFYDLRYLEPIYLKQPYETNNIEVSVNSPDWADMEIREFNFDDYNIQKSSPNNKNYNVVCDKIPQTTAKKFLPPRSFYAPHIVLIPQDVKISKGTNPYISSTKELYGWYSSLVKSIDNKTESFNQVVQSLTQDKTSDVEKIKSIFYWVQDNIRYIAFEYDIMGFKPENCQNVFENGYGDCKGMANLTKEMLKLAGFDARLTWIGTSSIPYDYSLPSIVVDNHMICSVILEKDTLFLDATEKNIELGNYAHRIKGRPVLIENGNDYIISTIPSLSTNSDLNHVEENLKIFGDEMEIQGNLKLNGTEKTNMLQRLSTIPKSNWNDYFKNHINSFQDYNIVINSDSLVTDRDEDFVLPYKNRVFNEVIQLEDEIYIQIDHDRYFANLEIEEDRNIPIYFEKEYDLLKNSRLQVPAGYKVSYMPEPIDIKTDNYEFAFNIKKNTESEIQYSRVIKTKSNFIQREDFEQFKLHLKDLVQFYDDQIILTKK